MFHLVTTEPTFFKNRVDCTKGSSNIPERPTSRILKIQNMSIFPIILKLGWCNNFSTWTLLKLNGSCTPAFRIGSLSRASVKSTSAPPQLMTVGPIGKTLKNWATTNKLLSATGRSPYNEWTPSKRESYPPRNTNSKSDDSLSYWTQGEAQLPCPQCLQNRSAKQ